MGFERESKWVSITKRNRVVVLGTLEHPENVQRVRASIEHSPRRSARKHAAAALGISDRTVRRILHADLRMHPYKMMVAQELSVTDWETRRT